MIRKGDIITFKSEWRDKGDDNLTFVARSDEDRGRFDVSVLEQKHWRIWPMQIVSVDMIETINGVKAND